MLDFSHTFVTHSFEIPSDGMSHAVPPTANRQPPTANRQPPTADRQPPTTDRRPPTADRRPPTANRDPRPANRRSPTPNRKPPTATRQPPTANRQPPTRCRQTHLGEVRCKLATLNGRVVNAKPEFDDCAEIARTSGTPLAEVRRIAAEQLAIAAREL